ncbi:MAG: hypothetical protein DLM60_09685 [Pseudonocardiales bacterium]|nr:MAG: hypothetical protein DLM60_09685 [Pseudonocardiales bacterium]
MQRDERLFLRRATADHDAPRPGCRADPDRQDKALRATTTDPDSTLMPTNNGWVPGYTPPFSVSAGQIILATEVSTNPADVVSYHPRVAATEHAAAALDARDELGTLLFDAGYASPDTLAAPGPDRFDRPGQDRSVHAAATSPTTTSDPAPSDGPPTHNPHRDRPNHPPTPHHRP